MHQRDKKIGELESLLKVLEHLKPDPDVTAVLDDIEAQVGYKIPPIVSAVLQSKALIDRKFSDVLLGYEVLSLKELETSYSDRQNAYSFFGTYQIQENYNTAPDYDFELYADPNDHNEDLGVINNVKHFLPLFSFQGDYVVVNLKPEAFGELVAIGIDCTATKIAPSLEEHVRDLIGGLNQGVYLLDEHSNVTSPDNWLLKQKVRDGILEMDEYGEIVYEDASEPYTNSELDKKRVFKTPLIVPISVTMVIGVYIGYTLLYLSEADVGILELIKGIVFPICLLSQAGIILTTLYNSKLLRSYFIQTPVISTQSEIENLKPLVRTNMYSSLVVLLLMAIGALSAIMSLLHEPWPYRIIVVILIVMTASVINRYTPVEERIKNLPVTDSKLEPELNRILQCWMHRALPNF